MRNAAPVHEVDAADVDVAAGVAMLLVDGIVALTGIVRPEEMQVIEWTGHLGNGQKSYH